MKNIMLLPKHYVLICCLLLSFPARLLAQEKEQTALDWLNENTVKTHRSNGSLPYDIDFFFSEKGLEYDFGGRSFFIPWGKVLSVSRTRRDRVYTAYRDKFDKPQYEYVTPKQGVTAIDVITHIRQAAKELGYKVGFFTVLLNDVDDRDQ